MKLQFSISELSSYLNGVFLQVVDQYRILELEPGVARVVQNVKIKISVLVEQSLVQPF